MNQRCWACRYGLLKADWKKLVLRYLRKEFTVSDERMEEGREFQMVDAGMPKGRELQARMVRGTCMLVAFDDRKVRQAHK